MRSRLTLYVDNGGYWLLVDSEYITEDEEYGILLAYD